MGLIPGTILSMVLVTVGGRIATWIRKLNNGNSSSDDAAALAYHDAVPCSANGRALK